jgi:hypothetical protein
MDDRNPYAPSRASLTEPVSRADGNTGIAVWRDGDVLIISIGAEMPHRCVKCNGPADQPIKARKVYWHHPVLYLLVLVNIIIYAIVAAVVRKTAFVRAGLCIEHKRRQRIASIFAWTGSLSGIVLVFLGMGSSWGFWGALLGMLLILGSVIGGLIFARIVYAKKIDKSYVRLKGCGTVFLDSLPPFSGEPG